MANIKEHIKSEPPPQENHHSNRVYEKIFAILERTFFNL